MLVPSTCGWDTLAAAVVRRSQTAHCSHLRSRVSVGLEAPKGNQRGSRAGRRAEQTLGSKFGPRMRGLKSLLTRPRSGGLRQLQPAAPACATSIFLPKTQ